MSLAAASKRFDLSGRVVVVTGASKGIGRGLTVLLAETGAVVVPMVRTADDSARVTAEAQSRSLTVHPNGWMCATPPRSWKSSRPSSMRMAVWMCLSTTPV
ncbi:MAG TPA: SDR family NAD(P)-dependent oxidoreductase [Roseiarcus sp.]|jgi:NAD(P)-dependent dehydrogenase (short-subunit alcohol dehydrogenase family)